MNSSQLAHLKAHFAFVLSQLTNEQLEAISMDGYISIREANKKTRQLGTGAIK